VTIKLSLQTDVSQASRGSTLIEKVETSTKIVLKVYPASSLISKLIKPESSPLMQGWTCTIVDDGSESQIKLTHPEMLDTSHVVFAQVVCVSQAGVETVMGTFDSSSAEAVICQSAKIPPDLLRVELRPAPDLAVGPF